MYSQLEITTRCNFSCFYCAGRDMPQQDMSWEVFTRIVGAIAEPRSTVSLQGEGEPSLHPRFWEMVDYVRQKGHVPYTILNGSRIDAQRIVRSFPRIGISLDTLDEALASKIGRLNLRKVLAHLNELLDAMGPKRIVVMTVDMGQPLSELRDWVRQHGIASHIVQPLMRKADYARRYPKVLEMPVAWHKTHRSELQASLQRKPLSCRFLKQNAMRYYTWDGLKLPCCFIKDTQGFTSIEALRSDLARGTVSAGCAGCRELQAVEIPKVDRKGEV